METNAPVKNKGGRPLGSTQVLTREARRRAQETGLLPHEILLSMARGELQQVWELDPVKGEAVAKQVPVDLEQRKDAAKAAAPYYAPKISTVEIIRNVADDELDRIIAQLATETGLGVGASGEGEEGAQPEGTDTPRRRVRISE